MGLPLKRPTTRNPANLPSRSARTSGRFFFTPKSKAGKAAPRENTSLLYGSVLRCFRFGAMVPTAFGFGFLFAGLGLLVFGLSRFGGG